MFSQAGKTLSARRWHASFDDEGRLDIAKVLRRIQRGVTFIVYLHIVYHYIVESVNNSNSLSFGFWSICVCPGMFAGLICNHYENY